MIAGSAVVAVAAVIAAVVAWPANDGDHEAAPTPAPSTPPLSCPATSQPATRPHPVAALALPARGAALERRARPTRWSLIIHGPNGGFPHGDAAVVTYPATRAMRDQPATYSWRLQGKWATAHGYLSSGPRQLLTGYVRIVDGRPAMRESRAYPLVRAVPSEPVRVHELRYDARRLGAAGRVLGGLVFTGVTRTAALDDWLITAQPAPAGSVRGSAAVLTPIFGGNAALAWEPTPGTVAYVGYSGAESSPTTVAALHCLAAQSRPLSTAQWRGRHPSVPTAP